MKKNVVFLTSGESPDFGVFLKGQGNLEEKYTKIMQDRGIIEPLKNTIQIPKGEKIIKNNKDKDLTKFLNKKKEVKSNG